MYIYMEWKWLISLQAYKSLQSYSGHLMSFLFLNKCLLSYIIKLLVFINGGNILRMNKCHHIKNNFKIR